MTNTTKLYHAIQIKSTLQKEQEGNGKPRAKFSNVNHYPNSIVLCICLHPLQMWIFHGKDLIHKGKTLHESQQKEFKNALIYDQEAQVNNIFDKLNEYLKRYPKKDIEHWNTQRDVSESNKEFQKKGMSILPNPRARFCTDYLKIRALQDFAKKKGYKQWTNTLGLRYDEPKRVSSQKKYQTKNRMSQMPMYDAKHTREDVHNLWIKQNFDLA